MSLPKLPLRISERKTLLVFIDLLLVNAAILHPELFRALLDCQEQGVQITPMPLLYEEITGKVPVEYIGDSWRVALPLDHPSTRLAASSPCSNGRWISLSLR